MIAVTEKPERLREAVREAYSGAATRPADKHAFPVGRALAEDLGYPPDLLESVPAVAVEAFAGVSNVAVFADIPARAVVLDLGCGAGLDSLIASRRAGRDGRVVGIDFSGAMLARAARAAALDGARAVFCHADAERLPLGDGSVDVGLVNGIFNLNPARAAIFADLARVVRPGGGVFAAELVRREPAAAAEPTSDDDWFA